MFFSQAKTITDSLYRTAMRNAETCRKEETARKLDYFNNSLAEHVLAQIRASFKKPETIPPVAVNVVRKVINNLAKVYVHDAVRTVEGSERDEAIYSAIEDSAALPVMMKQANRLCKLTGNVLLRPVWRDAAMRLDVLTGDVLNVLTSDSPEQLQAVLVTLYPESGRNDEIQYSLWTPEEYKRLNYRGTVIEAEANPYHTLPFVSVWNAPPTDSFWQAGASDLMLIQDAVNMRLTDLCHTLKFQSYGVGYVKGGKGKQGRADALSLETGPGSMFVLPEGAEIGFAAPDAPISECLETVDRLLKWAAVSNGLPAASMSLDPVEESGISKIVGNAELEEQRRDDIANFARVEDQLFRLFRIVWNVHNPANAMSDHAALRVDFYDPKPVTSPLEQVKEWVALMEAGLMSPVDAMIARNPDLTRETAKAALLQIRDETKEFHQIEFVNLT